MQNPDLISAAAIRRVWSTFWPPSRRTINEKAFDEWLAERDRKSLEKGYELGYADGNGDGGISMWDYENPYKKGKK